MAFASGRNIATPPSGVVAAGAVIPEGVVIPPGSLVMGVPGGMPGTTDALVAAVNALPDAVTSWSATGIGRSTLAVALASLSKGGHLRVGMEDVLTLAKGVPVEHNDQLVSRVVELGRIVQRTPMTPAEAKDLLQTKRR